MKIILLSGGSGKRLWPLSNDARSKQFLRLLPGPDGRKESMIQRVVRQIKAAGLTDDILVATGASQRDSIENQLGDAMKVVTEPCRRDTFPAIALACSFLASGGTPADEPVIVMPCDSYADDSYFRVVGGMAEAVARGDARIVLMGIEPTYPSEKYGYIVPAAGPDADGIMPVRRFTEKPDAATAEKLIGEGALWNGGVFAFRLGYIMDIVAKEMPGMDFSALRKAYSGLPKISFDYRVVEKCSSVAVKPYSGRWKDLGTWNTLTDELHDRIHGNVIAGDCPGTYVVNELEVPLVCIGVSDLVIAASPDGILVSERSKSESIKSLVDGIGKRPMYEERRWGEYRIVDCVELPDGRMALTKQQKFRAGGVSSRHKHLYRTETWTIIDGRGEVMFDDRTEAVGPADVITIPAGVFHRLRADTPLTFIEVQLGTRLDDDVIFE